MQKKRKIGEKILIVLMLLKAGSRKECWEKTMALEQKKSGVRKRIKKY